MRKWVVCRKAAFGVRFPEAAIPLAFGCGSDKLDRMRKPYLQAVATLALGFVYWQIVCLWFGVAEPWDARAFWFGAYPVSLLLSGLVGLLFRKIAWYAGALLTFAQLPVVAFNAGFEFEPLLVLGLAMLFVLSIPATMVSGLAGEFRDFTLRT